MATKWSDREASFGGCMILLGGAIVGGIIGVVADMAITELWVWHTGDKQDYVLAYLLLFVCVPVGGFLGAVATIYLMNRYFRRREQDEDRRFPVVHVDDMKEH